MTQDDNRHSQIVKRLARRYSRYMPLTINIRRIREARKLTIAQLADLVGISTPHMSEVERGKKNLNNHLLERIALALKVTPDMLIRGGLDVDSLVMAEKLRTLPESDKLRVEAFVEALLASREPPQNQ